eukprot:TRINITY_DN22279_c0_g1_i3.p1 TRINITY_DN22279_c0_g1~~TRINITY_DN22279_c0_g1_i3.p1  ORF type:complete len:216 (-),score=42.04 TRINITY_DN22279_c0_g1_i3:393-1040(-)
MCVFFFFFFKQKTAYEMLRSLVGSEMCIRDRVNWVSWLVSGCHGSPGNQSAGSPADPLYHGQVSQCHAKVPLPTHPCFASQRSVLDASSSWNSVYNYSLLNGTTLYSVAQARFSSIMEAYRKRNTTTELSNPSTVWVAGRPAEFNLYMTIRVPYDQDVLYRPGALESLRYGLINYMVVYLITASLIMSTSRYIFAYNVFETVPRDDAPLSHSHQD